MTDDERREAEQCFKDYNAEHVHNGQGSRSIMDFTAGYAAGAESMRDEHGNLQKFASDFQNRYEAERVRSAKLNEMLKAISRRVTTGRLEYGYSDLIELADWADRAIAEYEASRD